MKPNALEPGIKTRSQDLAEYALTAGLVATTAGAVIPSLTSRISHLLAIFASALMN